MPAAVCPSSPLYMPGGEEEGVPRVPGVETNLTGNVANPAKPSQSQSILSQPSQSQSNQSSHSVKIYSGLFWIYSGICSGFWDRGVGGVGIAGSEVSGSQVGIWCHFSSFMTFQCPFRPASKEYPLLALTWLYPITHLILNLTSWRSRSRTGPSPCSNPLSVFWRS